jgi:hypothetical protein
VIVWALVSRGCRETVELYLDESSARADLRAAVRDEPEWSRVLAVIPIDFDLMCAKGQHGWQPLLN